MIKTTSSTARASEVRVERTNAGRECRIVTQVTPTYAAGSLNTHARDTTCTTPRGNLSPDASGHILKHTRHFLIIPFGAHYRQERPPQRRRHICAYTGNVPFFTGFQQAVHSVGLASPLCSYQPVSAKEQSSCQHPAFVLFCFRAIFLWHSLLF